MNKSNPKISIVIFTYNRAELLQQCIESVLKQDFLDFELIISDNHSQDNTEDVVKLILDERIRYYKNSENLGLRGNLEIGVSRCTGDIVYLMGDDDILLPDALEMTYSVFDHNQNVSMVTRPYYWFIDDIHKPVRAIPPIQKGKVIFVNADSEEDLIKSLLRTAGQISGLAFRRNLINRKFHPDIFTTHLYIFCDMLRMGTIAILGEYVVAVRINASMCRHNPEIYQKSPTLSWIEMFKEVFQDSRYINVQKFGIKLMASDYEGLIQIASYGTYMQLLKEIKIQITYRPRNLLSAHYLSYVLICLILPKKILVLFTELYKKHWLSKKLILKSFI